MLAMELSESNVWARLIVRGMQSIPAHPQPRLLQYDDAFLNPRSVAHDTQAVSDELQRLWGRGKLILRCNVLQHEQQD